MKITKKHVEKANVKFFSANATNYNKEEPTYLPENKKRVRKILKNIANLSPGTFLDVGCGTGFLLDLAYPYFDQLFGIDITQAMLDQVNLRGGKIKVMKGNSEKLPFKNNQFNVCTSYGFLHHLYRLKPTLREIYRCMKKGGIFYSDQDPNYYYWKHLKQSPVCIKWIMFLEITACRACLIKLTDLFLPERGIIPMMKKLNWKKSLFPWLRKNLAGLTCRLLPMLISATLIRNWFFLWG